eukprot:g1180.t1
MLRVVRTLVAPTHLRPRYCSLLGSVSRIDGDSGLFVVKPLLGREGALQPGSIVRVRGGAEQGHREQGAEACVLFSREGHFRCMLLPPALPSCITVNSDVVPTQRTLHLPGAGGEDSAAPDPLAGMAVDAFGRVLGGIDGGEHCERSEGGGGSGGSGGSGGGGGGDSGDPLFGNPPTQQERAKIRSPLRSGTTAVDALTPLGRGQSIIVIGGDGVDKTRLGLEFMQAQALDARVGARVLADGSEGEAITCAGERWGRQGRPVRCVYAVLDSCERKMARVRSVLAQCGALDYTTLVLPHAAPHAGAGGGAGAADSNDSAGAVCARAYVAAATATAIAERCARAGGGSDTLVVLDGLDASHPGTWSQGWPGVTGEDGATGAAAGSSPRLLDRAELRLFYSALVQRAAKRVSWRGAGAGAHAGAGAGPDGGGAAVAAEAAEAAEAAVEAASQVAAETQQKVQEDDGQGGSVSIVVLWAEEQQQLLPSTGPESPVPAPTPGAGAGAGTGTGRVYGTDDLDLFRAGVERDRVAFLLGRGVRVDEASLRRIDIVPVGGFDPGPGAAEAELAVAGAAGVGPATGAAAAPASNGGGGDVALAVLTQHSEELKSLCDGHIVLEEPCTVDFRRSLSRIGMGSEQERRRHEGGGGRDDSSVAGLALGSGEDGAFGQGQWGSAELAVGDPRPPAIRAVAGQLRLRLAVAHELARDPTGAVRAAAASAGAGGSTVSSEATGEALRLAAVEAVMEQPAGAPLTVAEQVTLLFAVGHAQLESLMAAQAQQAQAQAPALAALRGGRSAPLLEYARGEADGAALLREIDADLQLTPQRARRLELLVRVFFQLWAARGGGGGGA